jgi:2-polyprenyl-3-methyl-5-hydroxy-6-metoxy-1,4-benzoquinol methylase
MLTKYRNKYNIANEHICPVCAEKTNTIRYVYVNDGSSSFIYICTNCTFMFARPIFIPELSQRQMDTVDDAELFNNSFLKKLHERFVVKKEIAIVKKLFLRQDISLLDIGCGTGWITNIWKEEGINVSGLEPSPIRGRIAHENFGIRILPHYIEELENGEQFDVVVMRHVIEHLADPSGVLLKVKQHLRRDGVGVFIVPNINCIGRYLFDEKWEWVLPWHCNFFNPKSLRLLLTQSGFKVEKIYQTPSPLWYPDSFLRLFPNHNYLFQKIYSRLSVFTMLPFAPLVALGLLIGLSDNITAIVRLENDV